MTTRSDSFEAARSRLLARLEEIRARERHVAAFAGWVRRGASWVLACERATAAEVEVFMSRHAGGPYKVLVVGEIP